VAALSVEEGFESIAKGHVTHRAWFTIRQEVDILRRTDRRPKPQEINCQSTQSESAFWLHARLYLAGIATGLTPEQIAVP
jgi:hypothetical protein